MADAFVTLIAVQPTVAVKTGARQQQAGKPQAPLGARGGFYETARNRQVTRGSRNPGSTGGALASRPTAPAEMAAAVVGDTVNLTWDLAPGAVTYALWWSTAPVFNRNTWTRIDLGTGAGSYAHVGRPAGVYYYAVVGVNAQGEGPISAIVSATVLPPALRAPRVVIATAGPGVALVWWDPVDDATGYAVYHAAGAAVTTAGTRIVATRPPITIRSLPAGQRTFAVATVNGVSEGSLSVSASATVT